MHHQLTVVCCQHSPLLRRLGAEALEVALMKFKCLVVTMLVGLCNSDTLIMRPLLVLSADCTTVVGHRQDKSSSEHRLYSTYFLKFHKVSLYQDPLPI